jgi:hypothetical protein
MLVDKIRDYSRSVYSLLGERRASERVAFNCTVTVSCRNRYGQLTTQVCTCLNLSDKGIGMVSLDPISPASDVYIHSETHNLKKFGRVCYCVAKGDRNFIGCRFERPPEYWN